MSKTITVFSAVAVSLLLTTACIKIEQEVPVTPGTVPPQIRGAAWEQLPIEYCVVSQPEMGIVDHEAFISLVGDAFEEWGVPSERQEDCSESSEIGNGRNEIAWGDLPGRNGSIHQAGETNIRYRQRLGGEPNITEADITIAMNPPSGLDSEECVYSTLLHEVGHLLGAHHTAPPAIMAPALTSCPQGLTETDREMIAPLYDEVS